MDRAACRSKKSSSSVAGVGNVAYDQPANMSARSTNASGATSSSRITQLDGFRGLSIMLVLAAHLLPLGPARWNLNHAAGLAGMSLFFTLSGYLIVAFLYSRPEVKAFLVRRLLRIVPLAWLVLTVSLLVDAAPFADLLARYGFIQNYHLSSASAYNSHYWSLCVEMHFYATAAVAVAIGGRRGLFVLPFLCLLVTALRVQGQVYSSIVTHVRVDEILAGSTLALIRLDPHCAFLRRTLAQAPLAVFVTLIGLWICSTHQACGPLNYLRPYLAALMVGWSLENPRAKLNRFLALRPLAYFATISYALYVIHGPLRSGWFAEGDTITRYLFKRPLTLVLTFALAHLSTFYFEEPFIKLARRLTTRKSSAAGSESKTPQAAVISP